MRLLSGGGRFNLITSDGVAEGIRVLKRFQQVTCQQPTDTDKVGLLQQLLPGLAECLLLAAGCCDPESQPESRGNLGGEGGAEWADLRSAGQGGAVDMQDVAKHTQHAAVTAARNSRLQLTNSAIFACQESLGLDVEVISGFEEARLIYLGVLQVPYLDIQHQSC